MGKRRKKKFYVGPNLTAEHNFHFGQQLRIKIEKYESNGVGTGFYNKIPVLVFNFAWTNVLVPLSKNGNPRPCWIIDSDVKGPYT